MVVAVGPLDRAKSRLAPDLSQDERRALVVAMLIDVLTAIRADHSGPLVVVSPNTELSAIARRFDAELLHDRGDGTNAAIALASASPTVQDSSALIVVQGDLPQLRGGDVRRLAEKLATGPCPQAVIVASLDGGTSVLALRPPTAIETAFGPGSGDAHRRLAEEHGIEVEELIVPRLTTDVDTIEDLRRVGPEAGPATSALLGQLGVFVQ